MYVSCLFVSIIVIKGTGTPKPCLTEMKNPANDLLPSRSVERRKLRPQPSQPWNLYLPTPLYDTNTQQ